MTARPFGPVKVLHFLGKGNITVTNSPESAKIRDSEGQKELALQLLENLRTIARVFESRPLRQRGFDRASKEPKDSLRFCFL